MAPKHRFPSVLLQPLGHLSALESTVCERSATRLAQERLHFLVFVDQVWNQQLTSGHQHVVGQIVSDVLILADRLRCLSEAIVDGSSPGTSATQSLHPIYTRSMSINAADGPLLPATRVSRDVEFPVFSSRCRLMLKMLTNLQVRWVLANLTGSSLGFGVFALIAHGLASPHDEEHTTLAQFAAHTLGLLPAGAIILTDWKV
jgi:hypothetical protein